MEYLWNEWIWPSFVYWPEYLIDGVYNSPTFIPYITSLVAFVASLLLMLAANNIFGAKVPEKNLPVVPEECSAWTIRKGHWAVSLYRGFYSMYPRDVCSYYRNLIIALILLFSAVASGMIFLISLLLLISSGLYFIAIGIFYLVVHLPEYLSGVGVMFEWIVRQGEYVFQLPLTFKIIGGIVFAGLVVLLWRSHLGQLIRLRFMAWKEKVCPLIRIVE